VSVQPTNLKGQVIVITGASSGIGAAAAKNLGEAGMKLVLTARREDRLAALADACGGATIVAGDILDPTLPQRLLDTALKTYGRCDVLFNNAGLLETGPVDTIDIERVCHMVRVNVEAAFRAAYVFLRHFKSVNAGHLLNTSSVAGMKVRATIGPYAATK
jgi:NADP-dependent 3-hydroxy acid dehydrogenase YdfG